MASMNNSYEELFTAIRNKCQTDCWFGPNVDDPRPLEAMLLVQPYLRSSHLSYIAPDDPQRFGFAYLPTTEAIICETEQKLGFPLPPTLRALYTEVANGGFGPQTGIRGALYGYEPYPNHDGTIVGYYPGKTLVGGQSSLIELQTLENVVLVPYGQWPRGLLQICDVGCCIEMCVGLDSRMYEVAASESDDFYWFSRTQWTLEEWLWRWVKGESCM
jgi:SMI1/KNR4 family protein SUKH-1